MMGRWKVLRLPAVWLALAGASSIAVAQQWAPPIQKVPHVFVQTEVLGVRGGVTRSLGTGTIDASPGRSGTLSFPLDLGPPSADHPTSIEIEITQNGSPGEKIGLTVSTIVDVTARSGDVSRVRRERIAQVDEGRSFFHQAYENPIQGTSVLLTMTPETREVPELVKPSASAPIVFKVTLSRVTEDGDVPLEDNELRTLEGSPVSYAFRIAIAGSAPVEVDPTGDASVEGDENPEPAGDLQKKPAKARKKSKKEREREALSQFQRSRSESAHAAQAGAPTQTATVDPPATPPPSPRTDELELTLLPRRVESGILLVEASLRRRSGGENATLVHQTHAVTPKSTFNITVGGSDAAGAGSYRFLVQSSF